MARNAAVQVDNNFVKGLITEATGLNYPENSCVETYDCEFDFFGRVTRRRGFDHEPFYSTLSTAKSGLAITRYLWKNVTGDGTISFEVVQIGGTLYFYNTTSSSSLSAGKIASTITLSTFAPSGSPPSASLYECQFADGHGKLYVFHPYLDNFYVTYNSGAGTVSGTEYALMVRDFEGATSDPYAIDNRPTATVASMDVNHKYNLYNQGWAKADLTTPELTSWDTARADVPSNCDVWWTFKNASEDFDTTWIARNGRGSTPAPKGHFILNAYNMDRQTASGLVVSATTSGTARSSTGAFHAGRVFYAGVNSAGYMSKIYFSQIIERDAQVGYCYQQADPTSEDLFDLLPADGGVISIPEAGTIYKLFSMANGLLVFAFKGVWFIGGSQGIGFTAVDYTVSKISSIRTISATSFVDVNGAPMWWNTDGIFTVDLNENGSPTVRSLTIDTIQSFYDDIPSVSKVYARGVFNPLEQTVQWLYSATSPDTVSEQHAFNRVLNFNVLTKAFYPWRISENDSVEVHGITVVDGIGGVFQETLVVNNSAVQVVDNAAVNVVAYQLSSQAQVLTTKYLISWNDAGTNKFTFAETRDENYVDWVTVNDTDYTSYFITGYKIHGNAMMKFQPLYVTIYNEGTGQAYLQGIWDYATATSTGRYSPKEYLVWDDANYGVQGKRRKIRGRGRTLQYYVKSLSGKPFLISGWSTFETGNTMP